MFKRYVGPVHLRDEWLFSPICAILILRFDRPHRLTNPMEIIHKIIDNPAFCSLVVAFVGSLTAIIVAAMGWICSSRIAKFSIKEERNRLIGFHKLEVYEDAIAEIYCLVPLYRRLRSIAYEKRKSSDIKSNLPELRKIINAILDYQNKHNALERAKVYSKALEEYVPFSANVACVNYLQELDTIEKRPDAILVNEDVLHGKSVCEMYLIDELDKYQACAERLKEEIESLDFFER